MLEVRFIYIHVCLGEGDDSVELTRSKGLCGTTIPKSYISSGSDVTLKFKSRYMSIGSGFQVIITAFQGRLITLY